MIIMKVSTAELKLHLGRYLQMVRNGETIRVTSHSHQVAKIIPATENQIPGLIEPSRALDELRAIEGVETKKPVDALKSLLDDRYTR